MPRAEELYGQHLITPFTTPFIRQIMSTPTPYFYVPRNTLTGQYSLHPFGVYYPNSRLIPNPFKMSGYIVNLGDIRRELKMRGLIYKDTVGEATVEMFFRIYFDDFLKEDFERGEEKLNLQDLTRRRFDMYRDKKLVKEPKVFQRIINLITRYREIDGESEAVELLEEMLIVAIRRRARPLTYDEAAEHLSALVIYDMPLINDDSYIREREERVDGGRIVSTDIISEDDYKGKSGEERKAYRLWPASRKNLYLELTNVVVNPQLTSEAQQARVERFALEQKGEGLKRLAEGERALVEQRLNAYKNAGLNSDQIKEIERLGALGRGGRTVWGEWGEKR